MNGVPESDTELLRGHYYKEKRRMDLRHFLKKMQLVFIKKRIKKSDAAKRCIKKTLRYSWRQRNEAFEFHKSHFAAFTTRKKTQTTVWNDAALGQRFFHFDANSWTLSVGGAPGSLLGVVYISLDLQKIPIFPACIRLHRRTSLATSRREYQRPSFLWNGELKRRECNGSVEWCHGSNDG